MRKMIIKEIIENMLYSVPDDIINENMDTPIKYIKDADLDWMNALDKIQNFEEKYDIIIEVPGNDFLGISVNELADYIIKAIDEVSKFGYNI